MRTQTQQNDSSQRAGAALTNDIEAREAWITIAIAALIPDFFSPNTLEKKGDSIRQIAKDVIKFGNTIEMSGLLGGVMDQFFEADKATSQSKLKGLSFEEQQARLIRFDVLNASVQGAKGKVEEFLVKTLAQEGIESNFTGLMASYVYSILDMKPGNGFFSPRQIENQLTRLAYHCVVPHEQLLIFAQNEYKDRKIS
jgi:hypothetical protein